MKNYITPNMSIRKFSDLIETTDPVTSSLETPYVTQLQDSAFNGRKAQINIDKMTDITKFSF